MDVLSIFAKIVVYRHFSYFRYGSQNGRQRSRDYLFYYWFKKQFYILASFCESFTSIGWMVLEILCVEPINPQYSGVLETCVALRYWFFEVLGSESVNWSLFLYMYSSVYDKVPNTQRVKGSHVYTSRQKQIKIYGDWAVTWDFQQYVRPAKTQTTLRLRAV